MSPKHSSLYILFLSIDFLKGIKQHMVQVYILTSTYNASMPNVQFKVDFSFNN